MVKGAARVIQLSYDIHATRTFAAENSIDASRAFIAPPGLFLYIDGQLHQSAHVAFKLPDGWTRVATGLDPIPNRANTFTAPDFDTLFDSPMLPRRSKAGR